ncbi:hypothetical protein DPMN_061276 [Dreissena polymorpha]|uniref:Uncharacterized protein n=1 Tax=Dreissena polymorpha TaxID=45954 RepID=A0A9D4HGZ5_DREPO|nr:hypothetical protein DPMN_061276 [Dreissena polymorpha]
MKFAVYLLVLLPMVYCASIEERFISGSFQSYYNLALAPTPLRLHVRPTVRAAFLHSQAVV